MRPHIANEVFHEFLREVHVVGKVEKGRFRFNHPEFGEVPGGVRIFRAERGSERVNTAERHGVNLAFELAAYRKR